MTFRGTVLFALVALSTGAFAEDETTDDLATAKKKMELLLRKGEVLEKMGDLDGALKLYEEALDVYARAKTEAGGEDAAEVRKRNGASRSSEAAVERALAWLARYQDDDGKWDCDNFIKHDPEGDATDGRGGSLYDVGVSSLALMAFLGNGHTDRGSEAENPYAKTVRLGLRFLLMQQDDKGCFGPRTSQHFMYNAAIATAAMCEAYRLTRNPRYKEPAQRGLRYLLDARNPYLAWRYSPRGGENDTSITGWCVYALERGRRAGLVDKKEHEEAMLGALAWIDKITDRDFGVAGYNVMGGSCARPEGLQERFPPERSQSMTASALVTRFRAGERDGDAEIIDKGLHLLAGLRPRWKPESGNTDLYYWFWGTRACRLAGGRDWKAWREALFEAVVDQQHPDGALGGSWDPVGPWGRDGGRVYSTALVALTLQSPAEESLRK